jgi:hypothetical protein
MDYGSDGDLTLSEYEHMGGMRQVVQNEIDAVLASDTAERTAQLDLLRTAFVPGLASINYANDMPMKRIARWADLPLESHNLLDAFVEKRLLVKYQRDGEIVVEVAIESLLRQWDALAGWLHDERNDLIEAANLEHAASEWTKNDCDEAWLLIGRRLIRAEILADKPQFRRRLQSLRPYLEASRREENWLASWTARRIHARSACATVSKPVGIGSLRALPRRTSDHHRRVLWCAGQAPAASRSLSIVGNRPAGRVR